MDLVDLVDYWIGIFLCIDHGLDGFSGFSGLLDWYMICMDWMDSLDSLDSRIEICIGYVWIG